MRLIVRDRLSNDFVINVNPQDTFEDVKKHVQEVTGETFDVGSIEYSGRKVNNSVSDKIFDFFGISSNTRDKSILNDCCSVPGCNSTKMSHPNKYFFEFPSEQIRCHQWALYCRKFDRDSGKRRFILAEGSRICSDHFTPDQFVKSSKSLLKRTAVPNVLQSEMHNTYLETEVQGLYQTLSCLSAPDQVSCKRLCRLCSNECEDSWLPIFGDVGKELKLYEKIKLCFPFEVKLDDPLPKQICCSCLDELNHLYEMADLCSITHEKLVDLFSIGSPSDINNDSEELKLSLDSDCPLCEDGTIQYVQPKFEQDQADMTFPSQSLTEFNIDLPSALNNTYDSNNLFTSDIDNESLVKQSINEVNNWQIDNFDTTCIDPFIDLHKSFICNEDIQFIPEKVESNSPSCATSDNLSADSSVVINVLTSKKPESVSSFTMAMGCRICGFEFYIKEELLQHSFVHSCKYFFQCSACQSFFLQQDELEDHLKFHRRESYNCNVCNVDFTLPDILKCHLCTPKRCQICSKIFTNKIEFSDHMSLHQTSSFCESCCKFFADDIKLQKHCLYVHSSKKDHCCEECGKVFKSDASKKYHQRIHEDNNKNKPFSCDFCGKVFTRHSILVNHKLSIHKYSDVSATCFTCTICFESFPNIDVGLVHMKNLHLNFDKSSLLINHKNKIYVCEFCDRCYSDGAKLNHHRETHPIEFPYECKFCGATYDSSSKLENHKKFFLHDEIPLEYATNFKIPKSYLCEFCERDFFDFIKYKEHLSIHFGPVPYSCSHCHYEFSTLVEAMDHRSMHKGQTLKSENNDLFRPFECHYCFKAFSIEDALIKHIRMHTGEKPFICDECGKGFSQSSGLYTHQKVHSTERPYSCSVCSRTFKIKGDRDVHVRKHSGERPYQCEFCLKSFMTQHVYSQHRKIHTGERPYKCDVCGISFRRSHVLTVHKRIHTGEKPNVCDYCGKKYRQKGDLLKHCRIQHGVSTKKKDYSNFLNVTYK